MKHPKSWNSEETATNSIYFSWNWTWHWHSQFPLLISYSWNDILASFGPEIEWVAAESLHLFFLFAVCSPLPNSGSGNCFCSFPLAETNSFSTARASQVSTHPTTDTSNSSKTASLSVSSAAIPTAFRKRQAGAFFKSGCRLWLTAPTTLAN